MPMSDGFVRVRVYSLVRDLHLYGGLFASPFILVFAISVIFLVHSWIPRANAPAKTRTTSNLAIPDGLTQLRGREQLAAARALLDQIGVRGEIGFIRYLPAEKRIVIPANVPGAETVVDVRLSDASATIGTRSTGIWDAMVFLHKMPGPHNVNVRVNTFYMQAWRLLTDATVYLILFLTVSGVYLWAVLRAERRVGVLMLGTGVVTFFVLVYALVA
jgi:hypothetical protein